LKIQHFKEIEEDASDRLWALLGQSVDKILTENAKCAITQHKIEIPIGGITVVAKLDIYYPETKRVEDWKVTSCWSFVLGEKLEWERQLNCYAWALRKTGFSVDGLVINAILRDWQKSKTIDKDYPRIPFVSKEIPLWSFDQQEQYIKDQLELHKISPEIECDNESKWVKPTTYAVMKKGRKTALRVLGGFNQAQDWCEQNSLGKWITEEETGYGAFQYANGISLVERKGEPTRCLHYCPVRHFCKYAPKERD
jgi:hypothetical protein